MKINRLFMKPLMVMLIAFPVMLGCSDDDEVDRLNAIPSIITVSPTQGVVGTVVTLTGINLADATSVSFGDAVATITENTVTSISTVVPADAVEGSNTITVNTVNGKAAKMFTVVVNAPELPKITSISSNNSDSSLGKVGDRLTITGENLEGAEVFIGDVQAVVDSGSTATQLIVIIPEGSVTGTITVTTAAGSVEAGAFTIVQAPVITSVAPENMEGSVGDLVIISGTNLEDAEVFFGDITAEIDEESSATELTFRIPEGALTGPITISTPGGEVETDEFTIVESPEILYVYNDFTNEIFSEIEGHGHDPVDRKNTEQVFEGEFSTKVSFNYNGWGEFGFAPSPAVNGVMSTEGYSEIVVSVYGMPGVSQLNFWLKEQGAANADIVKVKLAVEEGKWTTFTIPLNTLGSKIVEDGVTTPSGSYGAFDFIDIKFGATTTGGDADISKHTYYFDEIYFQ